MASYSILIKPSASEELEAVPRKDRPRIISRIRDLASNPRPPDCDKLSGDEKYRIRQGNYRILYAIQDTQLLVTVVKVGDRRDVCR